MDRGDLEAAAASLDAARALPWVGEGGRLLRESAPHGCSSSRGGSAEALDAIAAPVEYAGDRNPAWAPWRGLKARALAGLGRLDEAVVLAEEEVALPPALGGAIGARTVAAGAAESCAAKLVWRTFAKQWRCCPRPGGRWKRRVHGLSLGRSRGVADAEAIALLRAAFGAARACGARSVVRDAAAALAQRGHRLEEAADARSGSRPERRVIDLAAAGLEVNEVAQRLFLTPGACGPCSTPPRVGSHDRRPGARFRAQVVRKS